MTYPVSSLLTSKKSKHDHLDERRSQLYGDQAELRTKICSLGVLDKFVESKKELSNDMQGLVVEEALKGELQIIISKIKPFGDFSLSQIEKESFLGAEDLNESEIEETKSKSHKLKHKPKQVISPEEIAKSHISEMMDLVGAVSKKLPKKGGETFSKTLTKLMENYREAESKIGKIQVECSLVGLSTGYLYLEAADFDKILPLNANGEVIKSPDQPGNSAVNQHRGIFWKNNPSDPFQEFFAHTAGKLFCNISSAPAEFVYFKRYVGGEAKSYSTQASLASKGKDLYKILTEYPDWISKIELPHFGQLFKRDIVIYPQDAKPDNFFGIPEFNANDELVRLTLKEIDGDKCAAYPICKTKSGTHFVDVRSIIFCLPQMYQQIDSESRRDFRSMNPASTTLHFLFELWQMNQRALAFFREGNLSAEEMKQRQMPLFLLETFIPDLLERLIKIESFMQTAPAEANYMDLLKYVAPEIAFYYDLVNQTYAEKYPNDPLKAFIDGIFKGDPCETVLKPLLGQPILSDQPLAEDLKKFNFSEGAYEKNRNTPPEKAAERLLQTLDFSKLSDMDQKQVLKVLCGFPLEELTLRNCKIEDAEMVALIRAQPHLRKLNLICCSSLTDASMNVIAVHNRRLSIQCSENSQLSKGHLESFNGYFDEMLVRSRRETLLQQPDQITKSISNFAEASLSQLGKCIENGEWKKVIERMVTLEKTNFKSQAATHLIYKLTTTDAMRQIVKNNQVDVIEFLQQYSIALTTINTRQETFYQLCIEERNHEMLRWLCKGPVAWTDLPFGILRTALQNDDLESARLLIGAGADLKEKDLISVVAQKGSIEILTLLLDKIPGIADKPDSKGRVALFSAIEFDQRSCCDLLISKMKSVDVRDFKTDTLAMYAAELDRKEILEKLKQNNADLSLTNHEGMNVLHIAALSGSMNCFKFLLGDKPSPEALSSLRKDKKALQHLVVLSGRLECVRELSKHTASWKQYDDRGMAPCHYAAAKGHWGILSFFISIGFSIDFPQEKTKETPLMLVLRGHYFKVADQMITAGASLIAVNNHGLPALHMAASQGDCAQIRYLCQQNTHVDVSAKATSRKTTALHLAASGGFLDAIDLLVTTLGMDVNITDIDKKTPIMGAMQQGQEDAVRKLVRLNAKIFNVMSDGSTNLHYSVEYTHPILVEYILASPQGLKLRDCQKIESGHTALHVAMYQAFLSSKLPPKERKLKEEKQLEVIRILLRYHMDPNVLDLFQFTPLHLVCKMGRPDFAALLLQHGARVDIRNDKGKTAYEHGEFWLKEKAPDPEVAQGIRETMELLKEYQDSNSVKKALSSPPRRSKTTLNVSNFDDSKKKLFTHMKQELGFTPEIFGLARSLEEQALDPKFFTAFQEICRTWNLLLERPDFDCSSIKTKEDIWLKCISHADIESLTCLIPLVCKPEELFQFFADKQEEQIKSLSLLIMHFKGHEALLASDFPSKVRQALVKKVAKGEVKKFLDDPKTSFPSITPIKLKQIQGREELFNELRIIFGKDRSKEQEKLLHKLAFSLMNMHREWLLQIRLHDFRHLFDETHSKTASALMELDQAAKNLTGNCLVFLLSENEPKRRSKCFEFTIAWMSKSLELGDFHQAHALYKALTHPAVLRIFRKRKIREKMSDFSLQQLQAFETLFSSAHQFLNYDSALMQRLTPSVPSLEICRLKLSPVFNLKDRYDTLRDFQKFREFAGRLKFPPLDLQAKPLLFLTRELYVKEFQTKQEKEYVFPGEGFAWEQSYQLEPPKI